MKKVLLTGITGFLGSHTAIKLLEKGYHVTGTMRSLDREDEIQAIIHKHAGQTGALELAEADLLDDAIWSQLTAEKDYVMHIASPFPRTLPKNDEELVRPAKEGTLNILRSASRNGVKKVVLTSSTGAVYMGQKPGQRRRTFNEEDWTDPTNLKDTTPYFRSKTIAERAAWDFMENESHGMQMAVICPSLILGPILEKDFGTSANVVIKILQGAMPAVPKIGFGVVDVRSVADLHILAMEQDAANGQRFIGTAGYRTFKEIAKVLKGAYPKRKIPQGELPDFIVRLVSNFDTSLKPILVGLGSRRELDFSKAVNTLSWKPISPDQAILACAESVLEHGLA